MQEEADAGGEMDWELHMLDGSVVRAHQHSAGAKKAEGTPKRSDAVGVG